MSWVPWRHHRGNGWILKINGRSSGRWGWINLVKVSGAQKGTSLVPAWPHCPSLRDWAGADSKAVKKPSASYPHSVSRKTSYVILWHATPILSSARSQGFQMLFLSKRVCDYSMFGRHYSKGPCMLILEPPNKGARSCAATRDGILWQTGVTTIYLTTTVPGPLGDWENMMAIAKKLKVFRVFFRSRWKGSSSGSAGTSMVNWVWFQKFSLSCMCVPMVQISRNLLQSI